MGIAVITDALEEAILTALTHTLGSAELTGAIVTFYQNNVSLDPSMTLGDLSLANFDGFAPGTIASWRAPYTNLTGQIVISPSVPSTFECTGNVTINTLYGTALLDSTGATLLAAQAFDTPVVPTDGRAWQTTPELSVTGSLSACLC